MIFGVDAGVASSQSAMMNEDAADLHSKTQSARTVAGRPFAYGVIEKRGSAHGGSVRMDLDSTHSMLVPETLVEDS